VGDFLDAVTLNLAAGLEVKRLLDMNAAVVRRTIKSGLPERWDRDQLGRMIKALDRVAQRPGDAKAERAAELAEFAESLL
jgi:hypothetical protein